MYTEQSKEFNNYYTKNGKKLSKEEFISYYNVRYFTNCTDKVSYTTDTGKNYSVRKTSRFVETIIEKILKKAPEDFTCSDVALILAWKIGKISHTQSDHNIILHKDWKKSLGEYSEFEGFTSWNVGPVKRFGDNRPITIDIKGITNYLHKNGQRLNDLIGNGNIETALEELVQQPWQGIGTVYLITLLYFATNHQHPGKCPIYDRFAMRALLAIKENKKIGETVNCKKLPDKNSSKFCKTISEEMKQYTNLIYDIFGEEYHTTRDIDRALWVYGHLFKASANAKKYLDSDCNNILSRQHFL